MHVPAAAGTGLTSPFVYGPVRSQTIPLDTSVLNALTRKVPGDRIERLRSLSVVVVTAVAAATRTPVFRIRDGDQNTLLEITGGATQTASLTKRYNFILGYGALIGDVSGDLTVPLPEFFLEPGTSWTFILANGQAADTFTSAFAVADVFPSDPYAYPLVGTVEALAGR